MDLDTVETGLAGQADSIAEIFYNLLDFSHFEASDESGAIEIETA